MTAPAAIAVARQALLAFVYQIAGLERPDLSAPAVRVTRQVLFTVPEAAAEALVDLAESNEVRADLLRRAAMAMVPDFLDCPPIGTSARTIDSLWAFSSFVGAAADSWRASSDGAAVCSRWLRNLGWDPATLQGVNPATWPGHIQGLEGPILCRTAEQVRQITDAVGQDGPLLTRSGTAAALLAWLEARIERGDAPFEAWQSRYHLLNDERVRHGFGKALLEDATALGSPGAWARFPQDLLASALSFVQAPDGSQDAPRRARRPLGGKRSNAPAHRACVAQRHCRLSSGVAVTEVLDPLETTDAIREAYWRYLNTTFRPADPDLARDFAVQLGQAYRLTRGPILQAHAPYVAGLSLRSLVKERVLHPKLLQLDELAFPVDRPLYLHQEQAIRKIVAGRNVAIATGTGSGKTEAFIVPIVNSLLHESDRGTLNQPGVRALLLYPMNALANDQMTRLAVFLRRFPEITFGRYVGDTERNYQAALDIYRRRFRRDPLPNEMIDRQRMQETPPHILLTNYAMLEYLLLRPADSRFFDGVTGRHWRFVVLDEVHVYDGAKGAELAMLLRRVRDRVNGSTRGELACIGTSATLGRAHLGRRRAIGFMSALFDETFEWEDETPERQDLVEPRQRALETSTGTWVASADLICRARDERRLGADPETIAKYLPPLVHGTSATDFSSLLFQAFAHEAHVAVLQRQLSGSSQSLDALAAVVFPEVDDERSRHRALVALVEVAAR